MSCNYIITFTDDRKHITIALDKRGYQVNIFSFLHENIYWGYSIEAPQSGASNEYHNICFHGEIRKLIWKKKMPYLELCTTLDKMLLFIFSFNQKNIIFLLFSMQTHIMGTQ